MSKRRRSYESGHRPKYLVIIDGTPESAVAIRYAGRRAARFAAGVTMLTVVAPPEALPILGVGSLMEAESRGNELKIRISDIERYGRTLLLFAPEARWRCSAIQPAPIVAKMFRERTTMPRTTPRFCTT